MDSFRGEGELAKESFEISTSLNLIKILGLGRRKRYKKTYMNW